MSAADGMFSAPNATSWACGGLLARLEGARDGAVDQRVLEQVLRESPEGVLALSGEALAQAVAAGFVVHAGERYRSGPGAESTRRRALDISPSTEALARRRFIVIGRNCAHVSVESCV